MNPAGNPAIGFLYLCIGACGLAIAGLAVSLLVGLVRDFARLVALHVKGWE